MNILVIGLWPLDDNYHFELDLLQKHLDQGDTVYSVDCHAEMPSCDWNNNNQPEICLRCMGERARARELMGHKVNILPLMELTPEQEHEVASLNTIYADGRELKKLRVDNLDLGMAVLSSLVSCSGDPSDDITPYQDWVTGKLRTTLAIYRSMQNQLRRLKIDHAYIYNGRMAGVRALMRACESTGTSFDTYEVGCNRNSYRIYQQSMCHNSELAQKMAVQHWEENADDPDREKIAHDWYLRRSKGLSSEVHPSYTADQKRELLPKGWNSDTRNIVVFNSTEDELKAVSDVMAYSFYDTQLEHLEVLLEKLQATGKPHHVWLRAHPNLLGKSISAYPRAQSQWEELQSLKRFPNITLLAPNDPVDSYALMREADVALTFTSTAGVETAYMGTPIILLGPTFYDRLGCTLHPQSMEQTVEMLLDPNLEKPSQLGPLIFGYYWQTHGVPTKYATFDGKLTHFYQGEPLKGTGEWLFPTEGFRRTKFLWRFADKAPMRRLERLLKSRLVRRIRRREPAMPAIWKSCP